MECLPRITPPLHPYQLLWTEDKNEEKIALGLLDFPMDSIANKPVYGLGARQAQDWVCDCLRLLKLWSEIPEGWQRASHGSPEMTTAEGNTLEDIELLQWHADGRLAINAQIFVRGNRSATPMCKGVDWSCGLHGLLDEAMRIEQEAWQKQETAEVHFARHRLCGHCDRRVEGLDFLIDGMDEDYAATSQMADTILGCPDQ